MTGIPVVDALLAIAAALGGALNANTIDRATAGALSIGATNATSVVAGKTGVVVIGPGGYEAGDHIEFTALATGSKNRLLRCKTTAAGKAGDSITVRAGDAGPASGVPRGGGHAILAAGTGCDGGATFVGGDGGTIDVLGGGGGSAGTYAGGNGGAVTVYSGGGGDGSATARSGNGSALSLYGGSAGEDSGGGLGTAGAVNIDSGFGSGASSVLIGATNMTAMAVGSVAKNPTVSFLGTGQKTINGNLDVTGGLDVTGAALTVTLGVRMTEQSAPSAAANTGWVYTKDEGGDTELFYMDDGGVEVQITRDGSVVGTDPSQVIAPSVETGALADGEFGYISAANTLAKAVATSLASSIVFGCAETSSADRPTTSGVVEAAVIQSGVSVSFNDRLFLSATQAGAVTNVAPSTSGQVVAELGIAMQNGTGAGGTVKMLFRPLTPTVVL